MANSSCCALTADEEEGEVLEVAAAAAPPDEGDEQEEDEVALAQYRQMCCRTNKTFFSLRFSLRYLTTILARPGHMYLWAA